MGRLASGRTELEGDGRCEPMVLISDGSYGDLRGTVKGVLKG